MKIIKLNAKTDTPSLPLSAALGYFDGVHLGHRAVIEKAVEYARQKSIQSCVWTIDSLPKKGGDICSAEEKARLIGSLGVDYIISESFDDIRSLSPESFVFDKLIGNLGIVHTFSGHNFTFGQNGKGDSDTLCRLMKERGFGATVVGDVSEGGELVSSRAIRAALTEGNIEKAVSMLGHSYSIGGKIIRGRQIGTKMGMPTVNIEYSESGIPLPEGVYASEIEISGKTYRSISNFGANPTVCDNGQLRLETHILADVGELYGEYARVNLLTFMRREHKFENIDALRSQIEKYVKARYEMDI